MLLQGQGLTRDSVITPTLPDTTQGKPETVWLTKTYIPGHSLRFGYLRRLPEVLMDGDYFATHGKAI